MRTSLRWLHRYLTPADLTAEEADHVLTHVGFPIEEQVPLPDGDVQLDVELTSNRGDCLCHVGLAREIAASTGRALTVPRTSLQPTGPDVSTLTSVDNRVPEVCPVFTARIIRGVTVGPSPDWLVGCLEAIGQRSINNIVDISNFVLFELGHPNHTFDLDTLKGGLVVRYAEPGEKLTCLDDIEHKLAPSDLVVADQGRAVSLAGVIGGRATGVSDATRNVLIEVATWDPTHVRNTARRHQITTDAGHRFERYVDARDVEAASQRVAELILEIAGGELCEGVVVAGRADAPRTEVDLRLSRCEHLLGIAVPRDEVVRLLRQVGVEVAETASPDVLHCTIPPHRHDVTREVDLIEEVIRLRGIEHIEVSPRMSVSVSPPQADERAARLLGDVLTGLGFYETVTVSFLTRAHAAPFVPPGVRLLKVDEERRKENPFLRPAIIPSLLTCRKANQDGRVQTPAGVRLFETAAVF
ncbi:MAG: phenylalanine--tRNA ligase subunit beta, partial [Phycisphaerales bacterium]|nr:phenylalanine--tRNA ligase subunit beta [Phycisphaerales bacterium]